MTRTRAQRETSAGGVVVRLEATEPRYLLIRDSYANWGFPKGHVEPGERPDEAALREVREETGLGGLSIRGAIDTIDWYFRFRGRLIHKVCHFYLMETAESATAPQQAEGITACQWMAYDEADTAVSYANARIVLRRAREMIAGGPPPVGDGASPGAREVETRQLALPLDSSADS